MDKEKLLGKTPVQLREIALSCGLPSYAGSQMAQWLYRKKVRSIDQMTNLSRQAREILSNSYEIGVTAPDSDYTSSDGTRKYLFPVSGGNVVESVMIPDQDRRTLCVSSQAGCKMGCRFCMTGRQGFHGNLTVAEILSQFFAVEESDGLTNAVFMGMGEPLDNFEAVMSAIEVLTSDWGLAWSPKRITVSTIGVLPRLREYLERCRSHLAISLHDPFAAERESIMPVQRAYPLQSTLDLLREYDFSGQRRLSFEYTMFAGFNDDKRHADALARMLRGIHCRVNLIRFHKIPDFPYGTTPAPVMESFRARLEAAGITCTIRASRGEDIFAACGLLAGKHNA